MLKAQKQSELIQRDCASMNWGKQW